MKKTSQKSLVLEEVGFFGHPYVSANHETTIEITTDEHLTPRGDCIVGVRASVGASGLSAGTKEALRSDSARVRFTLVTPGGDFSFSARGSRDLTLENPTDLVIRRSAYTCGRTLAIGATASASQIPRPLVGTLKSPNAAGLLRIEVLV